MNRKTSKVKNKRLKIFKTNLTILNIKMNIQMSNQLNLLIKKNKAHLPDKKDFLSLSLISTKIKKFN